MDLGQKINLTQGEIFRSHIGLSLSFMGFRFLSCQYSKYEFLFNRNKMKSHHYITLGKEMTFPYYILRESVWIFSSDDAVLIKMSGGILPFLEYKADTSES